MPDFPGPIPDARWHPRAARKAERFALLAADIAFSIL